MTNPSPPSSPAPDNPLWVFSLGFYRHREVQDFLLQCQDERGADVCLMLWASFLAASGRQLSEEGWRVADRALLPRRRIITSVRSLRRLLGRLRPATRVLYEYCKSYELKLERLQLATLWQLQRESWPEDRPALALAGQQYGLPQKEQARWAGLLDSYCSSA